MTLSVALRSALSGMSASQTVIGNISNNIVNANTEGYTRKIVGQTAVYLDGSIAGVRTENVYRNVSDTLIREIRGQVGQLEEGRVQNQYYDLMQDLFGAPGSDSALSSFVDRLGLAFQDLAVNPQSSTLGKNAVDEAVNLAGTFNRLSEMIQDMRSQADREIGYAIEDINTKLNSIHDLNTRIVAANTSGRSSADLEDQRDQAIKELSGFINIQTFTRTNGETVVLMNNGGTLVDSSPFLLSYTPSAGLAAESSYPATIPPILKQDTSGTVDVTTAVGTGKLNGLLEVRDDILVDLQAQLEVLATNLRDEINAIHNLGTAFPAPGVLTGTNSVAAGDLLGPLGATGIIRINVVDADGVAQNTADIDLSSYATIGSLINDINVNFGAGTASIDSDGHLVLDSTVNWGAASGIAITNNNGAIDGTNFSHFFGLNDLFVGTDNTSVAGDFARTMAVKSEIVANPGLLARGQGAGANSAGAEIDITPGDATIVQQMANKFSEALSYGAANSLPGINATFSSYASLITANNANLAENAASSLESQEILVQGLEFKNDAVSAVNIDEELAYLIQFENAFSASAQVLSVVRELFALLEEAFG